MTLGFAHGFIRNALIDLAGYGIIVSIIAAIAMIVSHRWTLRRLQPNRWSRSQTSREIALSVSSLLIFATTVTIIMALFRQHDLSLDPSAPGRSAPHAQLGALVSLVFLHDAYFYWVHRLLHTPWLYRHVHSVHHLSRAPTAFAAFAFHPFEAILMAMFTPLASLVLPLSLPVVLAFNLHMIIRNGMGHAGVELFPAWLLDAPLLKWLAPTAHHDTHHRYAKGNYGFYFRIWDRWMGTEDERFRRTFAQATSTTTSEGGATTA